MIQPAQTIIAALLIALVGGVAGASLVLFSRPGLQFDLGSFLGSILAAITAAGLAYFLGIRSYLQQRQQEASDLRRDAWARRYLDEGLDPVCRTAAADCEAGLVNAGVAYHLMRIAASGATSDDREYLAALARLRSGATAISHDHIRVLLVLEDQELFRVLTGAAAQIRLNDDFYNSDLRFHMANIMSYPPEKREAGLGVIRPEVEKSATRAAELYRALPLALVNISNAVQQALYSAGESSPESVVRAESVSRATRSARRLLEDMLQGIDAPLPPP